MKKTTLIIVLLIICILAACAACGGGKDTAVNGYQNHADPSKLTNEDFDNRFGMCQDKIVETEDAYYFLSVQGSYLYYFDKASFDYGVLCGKPECLHDDIENNKDCNGYGRMVGQSLNLWKGRLHFAAWSEAERKYGLFSIKLDGTDRRRDAIFDFEEMASLGIPSRLDYHRGKLYGINQIEKVKNGEPLVETSVLSFDPETGKMNRIYVHQGTEIYFPPVLFYYRQYVYFIMEKTEQDDEGDRIETIELRRWNTETETAEDVFTFSGDKSAMGSRFKLWVESEDRIYLLPQNVSKDTKQKLYLISGGELDPLFEFDLGGYGYISKNAALTIWIENGQVQIELRNFGGEMILAGKLDTALVDGLRTEGNEALGFSSVIVTDSDLIVCYSLNGKSRRVICPVRYDLKGETEKTALLAVEEHSKNNN